MEKSCRPRYSVKPVLAHEQSAKKSSTRRPFSFFLYARFFSFRFPSGEGFLAAWNNDAMG